MEGKKSFRLWWRWSLVSGALIALFWTAWFLKTGEVPMEHVSRWVDVLMGPIWSGVLVALLYSADREPFPSVLLTTAMLGWLLSLIAGFIGGIGTGLLALAACGAFIAAPLTLSAIGMGLCWLLARTPGVQPTLRWLSAAD